MAVEYSLKIGQPATPETVGHELARTAASLRLTEGDEAPRFGREATLLRSGMFVWTCPLSPPPFLHPVEEQFGFLPVTTTLFRENHMRDSLPQLQDMIHLVTAVLAGTRGDAYFSFAGERTMLVRIADRITVNTDSDAWRPELIPLLPSHDSAALPDM